jgi:glutaredoxin
MYIILFLEGCPYSHAAEDLLKNNGFHYNIILFSDNINGNEEMIETLGKKYKVDRKNKNQIKFDKKIFKDFFGKDSTFPRVYKYQQYIGGYSDLEKTI